MTKAEAEAYLGTAVSDYIDTCPHCGSRAHFKMLFNESYTDRARNRTFYIVFRCVPCKKLILKSAYFRQNEFDRNENLEFSAWLDKFPTETVSFVEKFEGIVPKESLADFKEGVVCLVNGSFKAAVGMFRRSLQSAVLNLGANPEEELINQIKNLPNLTPDIKDWAHNIRIFGNWGVHPQDDNLKGVNKDTAQEAQSFLEEFFNYVYVMPNRVTRARKVPTPKKVEE